MPIRSRASALAVLTVAGAGLSSLFVAAPASAATFPAQAEEACGDNAQLIAPGVCEQVFTQDGTFTTDAGMTKLEALLVGAGGDAVSGYASGSSGRGYAAAGGGGEVRVVDLSSGTGDVDITIGGIATVQRGTGDPQEAVNGSNGGNSTGTPITAQGGSSGNLKAGAGAQSSTGVAFGGGGGAGGAAGTGADGATGGTGSAGGPGVTPAAAAAASGIVGSLFADDDTCYGGGGAAGDGAPGCATTGDYTGNGADAPTPAGSTEVTPSGSAGFVAIRFTALPITLDFAADGGSATADQTLTAGTAPTKPTDPTKSGATFDGWYTDEQLTTMADFSQPLTESTTFYAKFTAVATTPTSAPTSTSAPAPAGTSTPVPVPAKAGPVKPTLANTGADAATLGLASGAGATALLLGGVLMLIARRRRTH